MSGASRLVLGGALVACVVAAALAAALKDVPSRFGGIGG